MAASKPFLHQTEKHPWVDRKDCVRSPLCRMEIAPFACQCVICRAEGVPNGTVETYTPY